MKKRHLIVIGHPDKKSFCWNGIYKTVIRQMRKHKQNYRTIDLYSDSFQRPRTELIKKYAQAFACISMFLVGAPLGALIKRGGLGIPVIISILFYIIYYVLNILGLKWAREDLISPFLAAWMSNLLIFPLGLLLLYLARKDSRIFDYNIIESIKTKFLIFQKKQ